MHDNFVLWILIWFFVGASVGSFLCAMSDRKLRGLSILSPRSHCGSCGKTLSFWDLFPLKVWLFNQGKCRSCQANIPKDTIVMEVLTGFLYCFVPIIYNTNGFQIGEYLFFATTILYIALMDLKTLFVPLESLLVLIVSGVFFSICERHFFESIRGLLAGAIFLFVTRILYKKGIGEGDIIFLGAIGLFVGAKMIVPVVILSSAWGILAFMIKKHSNHEFDHNKKIPFTPFLGGAGILVYLLQLMNFFPPSIP